MRRNKKSMKFSFYLETGARWFTELIAGKESRNSFI